jgi:hypothetical protein
LTVPTFDYGYDKRNLKKIYTLEEYIKIGESFYGEEIRTRECFQMHKEYILNKTELLRLISLELKDMTLGCFESPAANN